MDLKKTPLYDAHVALNAKMVDFGGWALPVQYSSILEEHRAVRENCGLFDVSHMGELFVRGKDSFSFLQHMLTNDLTGLLPGRCRYSMVCHENGGVVDDILVYMFSEEFYLLVVNAGNTEKDFNWFASHAKGDVTVTNESAAYAQLALQGPRFLEVLEAAGVKEGIPEKNYAFAENLDVGGVNCLVSRTGYTGEDGVELYCKPEHALKLHALLLEAGKPAGLLPCGLGARDTLRFEAAMPLYGHEMDETVTPLETNIAFCVKLSKPEFIGKDAIVNNPPRRMRIGLKLVDKGIAREHADVYVGEKKVGHVTSGSPAPSLGGNYAMALVDIDESDCDEFLISVRDKKLLAERVVLPFYKRQK
ncbi:MAG: glycine cleavage system aminomethyltransferase GcvT [Clostridiaceae bacterium]|nr:glycine cleavage system aminomethyltransferase GcvT [Eubacteriales bacterium]